MPGHLTFIEVENFKSYKGKQKIGPLQSFTSVIGPNGSGKSNFMDCISFVLGEKTNNLRVKRVNELIHGASIGQPVANTASVTLVYEDSDTGKKTRFSRVVQGSSSDYRIDGASVSKNDYAERLLELGINVKARNFLVYQGAVESIAMKNPREITALFEEISHSNEYKEDYVNKKVRMDRSEEELHHMYVKKKGIAAEKKEAQGEINEAKKYQNLKEELNQVQSRLQLFKLYHIEQDLKELQKELEKKRKELDKQIKKKDKIDEEVKARKNNHNKLFKELSKIERDIRDVEMNLNKKRPAYIKAKENVSHIEKKLETAKKSLSSAKKSHDNHQETISELQKEFDQAERRLVKFDKEMARKREESRSDIVLEEEQRREYDRLKEEVAAVAASIRTELDTLEREQKSDGDRLESVLSKKQELESKIRFLETERTENLKRIEKLRDNIDSSDTNLEDIKNREQILRKEVDEAKKKVVTIQEELDNINNQLGDAKGSRHEDERRRKKAEVVDSLKKLYGKEVYDRMVNLCKPSHKKYNIAITRVMGKSMEAIVVATEKTGRLCIQYLKEQMMEPETFLPLDYIEHKPLKERLRSIQKPKDVHPVFDVVRFSPPEIEKVVLFATNNALVCETAEDANQVAFEFGDGKRYDCVALDGTFYQKCGFISGGSAELERRAQRWDDKDMNKLKNKKDKLVEELREHLKKTRKESDLSVMTSQVRGLEQRVRYCKQDLNQTEKRNVEIEKEIKKYTKQSEEVDPDIQKIRKEMSERKEKLDDLRERMNTVEDEKFKDFCEELGVENIRQYEERQNKQSQEQESRKLQLQNELNAVKSRLEYESSKDTEANVRRWEKAVSDEAENLKEANKAEKKEKDGIAEEMDKLDELKKSKGNKKNEVDALEGEMTEEKKGLSIIQKEISAVQKQLMGIECKMESKRADRHAVLLSCKMECIDIPLESGDMDLVAGGGGGNSSQNDDDDDDDMETESGNQGTSTQKSYKVDESIKPDYSSLTKREKDVSIF